MKIKKGDKIKYEGEEYIIQHIATQVTIKNIKSGKMKKIKIDELS